LKVVYATATSMIGQALIKGGTHWPADDPLVLANPTLFSDNPRYGLFFSVEPAAGEAPPAKRSYIRRNPDSLRVE
jgi:hypothetical protein